MDLSTSFSIVASELSLEHDLPLTADIIIHSTSQEFKAVIWIQNADFKDISNVEYFPRK